MSALTTLSEDLSTAVETASRSVVAVHGGRRFGASGVQWRDGVVVTTDHALERDEDLSITLPDGNRVDAVTRLHDSGPTDDYAERIHVQERKAQAFLAGGRPLATP